MTPRKDGRLWAVQFCGCGCETPLPRRRRGQAGRTKKYLNDRHRHRALELGLVGVQDDLPAAEIDALIAQARMVVRWERAQMAR